MKDDQMYQTSNGGSLDYQGKCPIPGCDYIFKTGHNGIDAHVKGNRHDADFEGIPLEDRYRIFLQQYPRAQWPRIDEKVPSQQESTPKVAHFDDVIKSETHHSTYREKLIEHIFISKLLQEAWLGHQMVIDVLHSEIDASGYDLVLEWGSVVRHVQLKSSRWSAQTTEQRINSKLAEKPAGCVVWIMVHEDFDAHRINLSYLFFGGKPNEPLPLSGDVYKQAKHSKANSQGVKNFRPGIRVVPKRDFRPVKGGIAELLTILFGNIGVMNANIPQG